MVELPPVTVDGEGNWDWAFMERQFPRDGQPGLTYTRVDDVIVGTFPMPSGALAQIITTVDSLTVRNRKGRLVGILSYWPDGAYLGDMQLEAPGNASIWVRPDRRGRGIGLQLIREADRRWSIDWTAQHYTAAGRGLVAKYLRECSTGDSVVHDAGRGGRERRP